MEAGSRELARAASAHVAGIAFALAYLITTATGGGATAALVRGTAIAAVALFASRLLLHPLLGSVLDAMARDTAGRSGSGSATEGAPGGGSGGTPSARNAAAPGARE